MDFQKSVVISVVLLLSFMLAGGFYVKRLPPWLHWYQYVSYINYVLDSMRILEFTPNSYFKYVTCSCVYLCVQCYISLHVPVCVVLPVIATALVTVCKGSATRVVVRYCVGGVAGCSVPGCVMCQGV